MAQPKGAQQMAANDHKNEKTIKNAGQSGFNLALNVKLQQKLLFIFDVYLSSPNGKKVRSEEVPDQYRVTITSARLDALLNTTEGQALFSDIITAIEALDPGITDLTISQGSEK